MSTTEPTTGVATDDVADRTAVGTNNPTEDSANRLFSTSILISATRCLLAYVVFPWLLPALGLAKGIGPGIGVVIGTVAIGFNVYSIRRFHRADHRWKWQITALNVTVIAMLTILLIQDLAEIF